MDDYKSMDESADYVVLLSVVHRPIFSIQVSSLVSVFGRLWRTYIKEIFFVVLQASLPAVLAFRH